MKNTEGLFRVNSGHANTEDKQSVLSNLDQDNDSKQEYNQIKNAWALLASEKEMPSHHLEQLYINFQQKLNSRKPLFKLYGLLKYVAIFILAAGISSLYFYYQNESKSAKPSICSTLPLLPEMVSDQRLFFLIVRGMVKFRKPINVQ